MKIWLQARGKLSEIYSSGLEYSLVDAEGKGLHSPVFCKDFFTDIWWSEAHKKPVTMYGFKWEPNSVPEECYVALRVKGESLGKKADSVEIFLSQWEERFGLRQSFIESDDTGDMLVVRFNPEWTSRPVMISLFTLLLRLSLAYKEGSPLDFLDEILKNGNPYGVNDRGEMSKYPIVKEMLWKCWENREAPHPHQTWMQYENAYACHHSGGFIAFTTGHPTG